MAWVAQPVAIMAASSARSPTFRVLIRMLASISRSSSSFLNGFKGETGSWGHRINIAQAGQGRADHIKTKAIGG